jgi:FAD-linked sulfhydryl oxidase
MIRTSSTRNRIIILALTTFAAFVFFLHVYQAPFGHIAHLQQVAPQQSIASGALLTGHAIAPKLGNATAKYVHQVHRRIHAHSDAEGREFN